MNYYKIGNILKNEGLYDDIISLIFDYINDIGDSIDLYKDLIYKFHYLNYSDKKINKGFYCYHCNKLFITNPKKSHILSYTHKSNKFNKIIKYNYNKKNILYVKYYLVNEFIKDDKIKEIICINKIS